MMGELEKREGREKGDTETWMEVLGKSHAVWGKRYEMKYIMQEPWGKGKKGGSIREKEKDMNTAAKGRE